jgi:hypothetical protein
MNMQQYLHLKQELQMCATFMQALAKQVDRLQERIDDIEHSKTIRLKANGENAATVR